MIAKLTSALLKGDVTPPPSKSQAHRVVIAAALAKGESHITPLSLSMDIKATLGAVTTLGASYDPERETVTGMGGCLFPKDGQYKINCEESGSTLRFMIPISLAVAGGKGD